ncbi:SRPBCC family protein [Bellilinea sp.]|uniref:SRPBCC family protein n=1 Tax=Bellilinea sp. TaxID=2838785 RepID=UPI002ADE35DE|nr:SRPBCC family protein [Bellilinea sp.]
MEINKSAPAFARREMLIHAPVEVVWQVLTDFGNWPDWQPDITFAKLDGDLREGTTFHWKAQGLNITSRLHTVQPPLRIGWTGTATGMTAIHNWSIEARGNDTLVTTAESLSGWLTRLMLLFDKHFLEKSLEASLLRLKKQAESR